MQEIHLHSWGSMSDLVIFSEKELTRFKTDRLDVVFSVAMKQLCFVNVFENLTKDYTT